MFEVNRRQASTLRLPIVRLVLVVIGIVSPASGHSFPDFRYDRTLVARARPDGVTIRYTLELNAATLLHDAQRYERLPRGTAETQRLPRAAASFAAYHPRVLAGNIALIIGGERMPLAVQNCQWSVDRDRWKFRMTFHGSFHRSGGEQPFTLEDRNSIATIGAQSMSFATEAGLELVELVEPLDLRNKDPRLWKPGDSDRARHIHGILAFPELGKSADQHAEPPRALPPATEDRPVAPPEPNRHPVWLLILAPLLGLLWILLRRIR
ncbi:MAG: hypothetical protein ACRCZF_17085 [Gemmataceae bacterium]